MRNLSFIRTIKRRWHIYWKHNCLRWERRKKNRKEEKEKKREKKVRGMNKWVRESAEEMERWNGKYFFIHSNIMQIELAHFPISHLCDYSTSNRSAWIINAVGDDFSRKIRWRNRKIHDKIAESSNWYSPNDWQGCWCHIWNHERAVYAKSIAQRYTWYTIKVHLELIAISTDFIHTEYYQPIGNQMADRHTI